MAMIRGGKVTDADTEAKAKAVKGKVSGHGSLAVHLRTTESTLAGSARPTISWEAATF